MSAALLRCTDKLFEAADRTSLAARRTETCSRDGVFRILVPHAGFAIPCRIASSRAWSSYLSRRFARLVIKYVKPPPRRMHDNRCVRTRGLTSAQATPQGSVASRSRVPQFQMALPFEHAANNTCKVQCLLQAATPQLPLGGQPAVSGEACARPPYTWSEGSVK